MAEDYSKTLLYRALKDKYTAIVSEAEATLEIYFKNSVGIGEHTDILLEVDKWVKSLAEADENLEILGRYFDEYGDLKKGK